jgi:hypothetical protein
MRDDDRNLERLAALIEAELAGQLSRRDLIRRGLALGLGLPAIAAALAACGAPPATDPAPLSRWRPPADPAPQPLRATLQPARPTAPQPTATPPAPTAAPGVRFAVIGDYGMEGEPAAAVAGLVASWAPDFVVTTGDNNYPDGLAATLDRNVGQYYGGFIAPYRGGFGPGATENRFWPVLGNHDWSSGFPDPYLSYFALPGNGRYYSVERGPVALFALDSMPGEPDGIDAGSTQGAWLQAALAASAAPWKIVVLHHSPYSSGHHGSAEWMRWPFAAWGARLVLGGHDHTYERVERDGLTYVVNGLGGGARYARGFSGLEGSQVFFNADHGAMLIEADAGALRARFATRAVEVIDDFTLQL